jgi:hypothetical protein
MPEPVEDVAKRFAINQSGKFYYKTKKGVWVAVPEMNCYGLVNIVQKLEGQGKKYTKLWHVLTDEVERRKQLGQLKDVAA